MYLTSLNIIFRIVLIGLTSNSCCVDWITTVSTNLFAYLLFFFSQEELDLIDREDEQKFLTSADYLATNSMPSLISHVKSAVKEVLKGYISLSLVFLSCHPRMLIHWF